tara:strand:- start:13 stop:576 length:564 start_codon:yes stop_codon:yes gene_type:complete
MKAPLFEFPSYQYEVSDWDFKKKGLLTRIHKSDLKRVDPQPFETDRQTDDNKSWVHYLEDFLRPTLFEFCKEAKVTCRMTDAWCVRYQRGDQQTIHNHRGWGFSGVLYVEYDSKFHTPTCFMAPWQDPRTDTTSLAFPKNIKEGTVFIVPSFTHHFAYPNSIRKPRTIISFDLLPELPEHQSLNKNV